MLDPSGGIDWEADAELTAVLTGLRRLVDARVRDLLAQACVGRLQPPGCGSSGRRRCLALDDRSLAAAALCDLHAARLRFLGNRDPQREHALIVVSLKPVGIEALTEQELARESALRPFADEWLVSFLGFEAPLSPDR